MIPQLKWVALRLCRRRPPQEWHEVCSRVLAAFGEAVLRFPAGHLRKVNVNLAYRTLKRFEPEWVTRAREAKAMAELVSELRWAAHEMERCAVAGAPKPFDSR